MLARQWIAVGAFTTFLAVALGAFGAHGLRERVDAEALEVWKTGVLYHALHGLALVGFGLWRERNPGGGFAGSAFLIGVVLFSGSLYLLTLGAPSKLGLITPLGGTALLLGWMALGFEALKRPS